MKEAFELIQKRLRNQFDTLDVDGDNDWNCAMRQALSIVSEVEAEYGNGWIPCSERMPEDFKSVLCYAKSIARSPDTMFVGSQKHGCWFLQSSIGTESFPTQYEVIAWMPLPEPWKGE